MYALRAGAGEEGEGEMMPAVCDCIEAFVGCDMFSNANAPRLHTPSDPFRQHPHAQLLKMSERRASLCKTSPRMLRMAKCRSSSGCRIWTLTLSSTRCMHHVCHQYDNAYADVTIVSITAGRRQTRSPLNGSPRHVRRRRSCGRRCSPSPIT
jgi:hypothetical protein